MSEATKEFFVGHPWCSNVPRDEAVRAAEDGRSGPLPTLEEAISVFSPAASGAAETEGERQPIDLDDLQRVAARVRLQLGDNWLADMVEIACDEIARLRESLAIFVHAHSTGNSVPPQIEEQAKRLLPPWPEAERP